MGFTLIQENVSDDIRGRVFATLYTLVRLCLVIALTIGPLLAAVLQNVSPGKVEFATFTVQLPGVRLTLWLGGIIIVAAGVLAHYALRGRKPEAAESS
jgi:dTMP kinase